MTADLQKASLSKRIAAFLLDFILLTILITGVATVITAVTNYDTYVQAADARQKYFESEYDVRFDITEEEYLALSEEKQQLYTDAYQKLYKDEEFLTAYNKMISLILLILSLSVFLGVIVVDFIIPLFLKNGQTLGKKVFGIGLVRVDGVQLSTLQLFVRTVLGKFAIELMIPTYIIIMLFFNLANIIHIAIVAILLIVQVVCIAVTKTNSAIHDLMAGTVAIDISSQQIFRSTEELLEYTKKIHAERADRSGY
ncbi:MAG: RDD family protein [Ruminococcaceae bacterium]|nr:RDD family protein [Oscillospiraceae bacterium]